jgi:hypothetical protein
MQFTVNFANQTQQTWTLAIYLTSPEQSLDSVCWKQTTAPQSGKGIPQSWDPQILSAAIGFYTKSSMTYSTLQDLQAAPGSAWKIEPDGGTVQLVPDGSAQLPTQIQILNATGALASPGLGVAGAGALFCRDVLSGVSVAFEIDALVYSVEAFDTMAPGQLITTTAGEKRKGTTLSVPPQQLDFSQGTTATVSLVQTGLGLDLKISYS